MKTVVFCGYGKLAVGCLRRLMDERFNIGFILTHRDMGNDGVDVFALRNNIPYSYEDSRKSLPEVMYRVAGAKPAYLISVNYRYIIPSQVYQIPKHAVNIHGSLLPKYRGRTPHVWSIINGEEYAGITAHFIEDEVDSGDIIHQVRVKIDEDDTGYTLLKKYERLYPALLMTCLNKLREGCTAVKQSEEQASYFGKRTPDMGYIDFRRNAKDIVNFVRAQAYPYPGAYYYFNNGKKVIIDRVSIAGSHDLPIGVIHQTKGGLYVRCLDATLKILDYRFE